MREDSPVRQALLALPAKSVPSQLTTRLRVMASHERDRRVRRFAWLDRLVLCFNNLLKPLAVPAAGGVFSTLVLFFSLADTLNVQRYIGEDVPIGIRTEVMLDDFSPFVANTEDLLVEVSVNEKGEVTDFFVPGGQLDHAQMLQLGNLVLYSTFTPATAYGKPVPGKLMVSFHHINVKG
jgi:hypothetical protein